MSDAVFLDTSAVIAVLAEESPRSFVLAATRQRRVLAADTLQFEICNALTAGLKKRRMGIAEAVEALILFRAMTIELRQASLEEAVRLAAEHNLYGYDAYVLTAARDAGVELLTLDRRMIEVARVMGLKLLEA